MRIRTTIISLSCLMFCVIARGDTSIFSETYSLLSKKENISDNILEKLDNIGNQESVSLEDRLVSKVLVAAVLSSRDVDSLTKRSIEICDQVIQENSDTWQADYLRFARLANYGLLGNSEQQIPLAIGALKEINFTRLNSEKHDYLNMLRENFGFSGEKVHQEILLMLGNAYRETGSFDEAQKTYQQIENEAEKEHLLKQVEYFRGKYVQSKEEGILPESNSLGRE